MKKNKTKAKNGKGELSLESFSFTNYNDIKKEIVERIGKMPQRPKDLAEGNWTEQALRVLSERYQRKDGDGSLIETPEDMCWRVSWEVASAEARWGKTRKEVEDLAHIFYNLLVSREFLPNSPTLMNAGTDNHLQYSACFVLPVEDSIEGIFDAIKYQALIHKSGGGTGFSFSRLRPNGARVKSSSGTASGPVSFMRIFDAATNEIKQGGKRRGANMGILRVDHPDILEFIRCKDDGGITNFNISVAITDKFMQALEADEDYDLLSPKTDNKGRHFEVVGRLSAKKVWDEIAEGAWTTGDPGLVFIDRRNRGSSNPVPALGPIEATNPCGEQELYPYDACNLGSIFLTYFVKASGPKGLRPGGKKTVDWKKLKDATRLATRFLDNVIEVNPYPLEQIRQTVLAIRRIGLGVGGWADMLIELGIAYDSEEALELGGKIMKAIEDEAVKTSQELAKTRGPFPMWPVSIYKHEKPRRNSTVTTIAPTGTISIIAGSSSGIEPLFAIAYQHIVKDRHLDRTLSFINPKFEEVAKEGGFWNDAVKSKVIEHGVIRDIDEIPAKVKKNFGTAHEIHHDWHIRMQSAFQKYTENAVSKTINLENSVTKEQIKEAYLLAWKTDCKGITVFRDGCKDAQVLNLGVKDRKNEVKEEAKDVTMVRPFMVNGATYKLDTPVGTAFITINQDEMGEPLEVFINVGKAGSDVTAMAEALGRTISTSLRFRSYLGPKERAKEIALQLSGIGGRRSVGFGPRKILSLPDAVAAALSMQFGFKINGYLTGFGNGLVNVQKGVNGAGNTNVISDSNMVGAPSDGAGAVMSANFPASQEAHILRVNDHTTASVTSEVVSTNGSNGLDGIMDNHTQTSELYVASGMGTQLSLTSPKVAGDICPSCGASALVYEEGCSKCHVCGHSEC
ncbi:ribonucleoside-diphosphate reductase, adenosylcobalamin-dependent [Candidatus Woesebacteria bacterium RIFCSPHIGHO2_01_FULL_38_26b]|uniref:Vitamin B12-dependent ribonucleotide reductase n=2 Tax=Candidatus Woeseibacteriota TaxID=1752722 RepID=A0A1F7XW28_9BACT|nr:MAG: ribonucleoside-diphosphate reductase, adenosylcobalamin-dependent [Candidatus Woesebacteria bacterium RIFCSPHIGHO2_01_FULL_38_26b]